jgi:hypothetical protein
MEIERVALITPLRKFLFSQNIRSIIDMEECDDLVIKEQLLIASRLNDDLATLHPIKFNLANRHWIFHLICFLILVVITCIAYALLNTSKSLESIKFFSILMIILVIMVFHVPDLVIKYCLGNYKEHISVNMQQLVITPDNFDQFIGEIYDTKSTIYQAVRALCDNPEFEVDYLYHRKSSLRVIVVGDKTITDLYCLDIVDLKDERRDPL